ncbi:MAG: LacI family transcriptional regulator [Lachnospiraceae bacterium]|nr:LacI family transcriptional regulator [Lachnospiraceae bacterium]
MITIKEIASILCLSPTTVSNVVNGHTEKMSPATRQRIEDALIQYGFQKTVHQEEYGKALKLISVDFYLSSKENVFMDPFCSELLNAIYVKLQEFGRYPVCGIPKEEGEIYHKLQARNIEGGIVVGFQPWECEEFAKRAGKPVVFVDCGEGNYDNIGIADYKGGKEITEFMLKEGHRKIAFFCDKKSPVSSTFERFRGYCDALKNYGITYSNEDYYYLPDERHLRREAMRSFAQNARKEGYTAVFVVSDLLANEAISIFFGEGLQVPEDISVAGFDDNAYAKLSRPMLTTVRQPVAEKGEEAVKLLMQRIKGEDVIAKSFKLPVELIVRESVKNIN